MFIDGTLVIAYAGHGYANNHNGPLIALIEAYYGITVALNTVVTGFIVGKLYIASRRAKATGGNSGVNPFTNVITALVESGALYLITQFVYIVLYALNVGRFRFRGRPLLTFWRRRMLS